MTQDDKHKDHDHKIDPKPKSQPRMPDPASQPPVNPTGSRRENETDANRASDGARRRAEEGL